MWQGHARGRGEGRDKWPSVGQVYKRSWADGVPEAQSSAARGAVRSEEGALEVVEGRARRERCLQTRGRALLEQCPRPNPATSGDLG